MRRPTLIALILSLITVPLLAQAPQSSTKATIPVPHVAALPPAAEQAMASVDPEKIRAQVKFLASDLLEGRGTGARGGDIAAEYIATQFALYGLQPAGDNGRYLQKVAMLGIATQDDSTFALVPNKGAPMNLRNRVDFVAMDETTKTVADVDASIVWIGYGIDAPEFNWNDYKDVDVKGKVLLMMVNEPPSDDPKYFGGKALTYYGRWTYKYEEAARMGAVGVILIHKTEMASYGWDVVRNSWSGERSYLRNNPAPKLKVASWMQQDMARKLAQDCGRNLDDMMAAAAKPGFKAEPLAAKFKAHIVSTVRPFDSNYFGKHTPLPAKQVSLDLNFDDIPPLGIPQEVGVSGAERTTFYPTVESTAKAFGLAITPDPNPNAGHYYRSDHFSFARVGVPAFSVGSGVLYQGHDREWGMQQAKDFTAKDYHHPSDEYHPEMDFRSDAVIARFGVALGWQAANQANEVGWKSGDEFDKIRIASGTGR